MINVTIQTNDGMEVNYKGSVEVAGETLYNALKPYISVKLLNILLKIID